MGNPKISCLTASIRPERLLITEGCLLNQTNQDFEWIVISPEDPKLALPTWVQDPPKKEGDIYALNKAINAGIKASKGDLLVLLQDSIWIPPDSLQKFAYWFQHDKNWCVSGVGDQYDELNEDGKPEHKVWLDPRRRLDQGSIYECNPEDWETNFASLPKHLIESIGGWDEEMDKYYAWDNVAVAYRLDKIGAKFYLDQTNESFSYQHGRKADWNDMSWGTHNFWEWFKERPVKLDYLSQK